MKFACQFDLTCQPELADDLVHPSRNDKYKRGADNGRCHYRPELCRNDVKVQHKSHTGRNEKNPKLATRKSDNPCTQCNLIQPNFKRGEQQHTDDAGGELDTRKINY